MIRGLFFSLILSSIIGCQSNSLIQEVELPLATIKKVVTDNLKGGLRSTSTNQREFYSQYYPVHTKDNHVKLRAYQIVKILGDRRPYNVEAFVQLQQNKSETEYTDVGIDHRASQTFREKIKVELAKSRGDHDVIDQFRAF